MELEAVLHDAAGRPITPIGEDEARGARAPQVGKRRKIIILATSSSTVDSSGIEVEIEIGEAKRTSTVYLILHTSYAYNTVRIFDMHCGDVAQYDARSTPTKKITPTPSCTDAQKKKLP